MSKTKTPKTPKTKGGKPPPRHAERATRARGAAKEKSAKAWEEIAAEGKAAEEALTKAAKAGAAKRETMAQQTARRDLCIAALQAALTEHRCAIKPFLEDMQRIGNDGASGMLSCSYVVVPI